MSSESWYVDFAPLSYFFYLSSHEPSQSSHLQPSIASLLSFSTESNPESELDQA
jgi:hypothetical protein